MLVIPHVGQLSWKNPPVITIALILINIFVFTFFQGNDSQYFQEFREYYFSSGLARIEANAYIDYLEKEGREKDLAALRKFDPNKAEGLEKIASTLLQDGEFEKKLQREVIITPEMEIYKQWRQKRNHAEKITNHSTSQRFGYKPAKSSLLTAFTCMFLHGGSMHLIGNMVFLWLVGCMIEMSCGKTIYLATYLLTGIIASLFFGLVYSDSTGPLIGASGAISGLMGFYTILFARKKVAVFLSLGFYFTNTRVPAIILLPFWVGKEIYQLFLGGPSNVAYVAHIGGLVSGAIFGVAHLQIKGEIVDTVSAEEKDNKLASLMDKALSYQTDLDFDRARETFMEVLKEKPDHRKALYHLFLINKHEPEGQEFHQVADRLLGLLSRKESSEEECLQLYREYRKIVTAPKLSVESLLSLNSILLKKGLLPEAAAIITQLLKGHGSLQQLPTCLLNLGQAYKRQGAFTNATKCLQLLCKRYPDTAESEQASSLMRQLS